MTNVPDDLRSWALDIARRRGFNVAAVALANKLARVCWRVWTDQRSFERREAAWTPIELHSEDIDGSPV